MVSALRSIGIPARQVYVPLWSHCDDNHAWVEAWCDGEWAFLGACEPEEVLNKGWFSSASSRAMLVHSRWLLPVEEECTEEDNTQMLPGNDMCIVRNHTGRYAKTIDQEVAVYDSAGKPQTEAMVHFEVMNGACYGEIACVCTDARGKCVLRTGLGSIHVTASKDGIYGEAVVDTTQGKCCDITLGVTLPPLDKWEELTFSAPEDSDYNHVFISDKERLQGRKRLEEMNGLRREKESRFYDQELARQVTAGLHEEEKDRWIAIMKKACKNQPEIATFLAKPTDGAYPDEWKLAVLESLREKDYHDITAEVLEESCLETAAWIESYEDSLLVPYILCPRVGNEMLRPFRGFIRGWLEQESSSQGRNLAEEIRKDPVVAWQLVRDRILWDQKGQYGNLVTSAAGALGSGYGSKLTRRIVCVQLLRTLGIPARLDPVEGMPKAWVRSEAALHSNAMSQRDGRFISLERNEKTGRIHVFGQKQVAWNYFGNWTLARFDGVSYVPLKLDFQNGDGFGKPISVLPGQYRILTTNRLPNGNLLAKQLCFVLKEGQEREVYLELAEAKLPDLLTDYGIADFALEKEDGGKVMLSDCVKEAGGLVVWLGEDEEPTEHILNEIYERREAYAALQTGLFFVAARRQIRENPACGRLLQVLPKIELLFDDFGADMEALARRLYLEPGKLPLAVLIDRNMRGIYSVAGYNVGTGDMILKLIRVAGGNG